MDKNSDVFRKLQRIERLLELKKRTKVIVPQVEAYLRNVLQPLEDEGRVAEVPLDIPIGQFLVELEHHLQRIDEALEEIAA